MFCLSFQDALLIDLYIYINYGRFRVQSNEQRCCCLNGGDNHVEQHLEKEFPVVEAYTVIDPGAVVVHVQYASITSRAMMTSFWLKDVAH